MIGSSSAHFQAIMMIAYPLYFLKLRFIDGRRRQLAPCPLLHKQSAESRKYKGRVNFNSALSYLLVGTGGFEPPAPCSQGRCADQTALRPEYHFSSILLEKVAISYHSQQVCCKFFVPQAKKAFTAERAEDAEEKDSLRSHTESHGFFNH